MPSGHPCPWRAASDSVGCCQPSGVPDSDLTVTELPGEARGLMRRPRQIIRALSNTHFKLTLAKGERAPATKYQGLRLASTRAAGIDRHMIRRVASVSYGVNFKVELFTTLVTNLSIVPCTRTRFSHWQKYRRTAS